MNKINFETLIKKMCAHSKEDKWLLQELRNFCIILQLKSNGSKKQLCKRLNNYFKNIHHNTNYNTNDNTNDNINNNINDNINNNKYNEKINQINIFDEIYKKQQKIRENEEKYRNTT